MILIWQRWGVVVALFAVMAIGLGYLFKGISGMPDTGGVALGLFVGLGLVISAALLWFAADHQSALDAVLHPVAVLAVHPGRAGLGAFILNLGIVMTRGVQ
ncbi:MAG: hypothetical protein ABIQ01_03970 [Pseudolysinimonas sp.]